MSEKSSPRILAFIGARGGSRGLKNKNILDFAGKPLIQWTIEAATEAARVTDVIVSTDSAAIKKAAVDGGARAPFLRPDSLADDRSNINDAVIHGLEWLEQHEGTVYDYVVLLQPTQPLRPEGYVDHQIEECLRRMKSDRDMFVAVQEMGAKLDLLMSERDGYLSFVFQAQRARVNRQEAPRHYLPTGLFYMAPVSEYKKTRSFYTAHTQGLVHDAKIAYDIDTQSDFDAALEMFYALRSAH